MNERRNAIITIVTILFVLFAFSAASLVQQERYYSATEDRVLEGKPVFTVNSFLNEDFAEHYETYVRDQFVSRDKWLFIKTRMDILAGKKLVRDVYLGKKGQLFNVHLPGDYSAGAMDASIRFLEEMVQKQDAKVMLIPSADSILADRLPENAPVFAQSEYLEQVVARVGEENYIDIYSVLLRNRSENLYYATDRHWTSEAAFLGYQTWVAAMGLKEFPYEVYEWETATDSFLGSIQSKLHLDVKPDSIRYLPATDNRLVSVVYDFRSAEDSLYNREWLETSHPYGMFLDDTHVFTEITTSSKRGNALFVLKDSFGNSMIPYLLPHYDKIYVLDMYSFNGSPVDFIEHFRGEHDSLDVLVLCEIPELLERIRQ